MKHNKNKKDCKIKVSIMRPFQDMKIGARLKLELDNGYNLYKKNDTAIINGEKLSRNKLLTEELLLNPSLQEWCDIIFKIVINDDVSIDLNKFNGLKMFKNNTYFVKTSLKDVIDYLLAIENSEDPNEEELFLRVIEAMDRVINITLDIKNVFTDFYNKLKK